MKLRIKDNSLRLRLSQTEVQQFLEKGIVKKTIKFGATASCQMHYSIQKTADRAINATYNLNQMVVSIPEFLANDWVNSSEISLRHTYKIDNEDMLTILIEKDFKCLKDRAEDEHDLYPHPEEGNLKC